jgi:formate hydrogenlyase subunit 4
MDPRPLIHLLAALLFAPLLLGVIHRTKALFAGRQGPPYLQLYFDLWRLLRKGAVYSRTTTWLFRAGPVVGLAATLLALAIVPMAGSSGVLAFPGDLVLLAYGLGLGRFFTVTAALDTGSAFEGMGASREVQFSALAEPALLLGLAAIGRRAGSFSLSEMMKAVDSALWVHAGPEIVLVAVAVAVVLLSENSRLPVDDPNTHLELTMIHEVMVLDHSGPDFAFILYGAALKLWVFASILVGLLVPLRLQQPFAEEIWFAGGMLLCAMAVGAVESSMARLKLVRVPQFLIGASALSALALVLSLR